jgi:SAM-dependent methyltransferase
MSFRIPAFLKRIGRKLLIERFRIIPRWATLRPYALPGVARVVELRWAWLLRRRRVLQQSEYAASVDIDAAEELVDCPLCHERRVQPLFTPRRHGQWSYRVVRCPSCGMLYRNPGIRPERVGDLYGGGYASFLTGRYAEKRQDDYRVALDAYGAFFSDGAGRRLLDYGCGVGLFLEVARERGYDVCGIDLAPDAVREARRRGFRAWCGTADTVPEVAAGGFHVVTLWSVLAHLPRPIDELAMLRRLLLPDGVLLVSTVNANSLLLKAYGERWGGFTRNHLIFSSPTTLPRLLRAAGFAAVYVKPMYGGGVERGEAGLSDRQEHRLYRAVMRGNQGTMLRALAFASADGPRANGLLEERDARPQLL